MHDTDNSGTIAWYRRSFNISDGNAVGTADSH